MSHDAPPAASRSTAGWKTTRVAAAAHPTELHDVTGDRDAPAPDTPSHLLRGDEPTLPSQWYIDPAHHRRELAAIWYRRWLCVGREEELPAPRHFAVFEIGDQSVLVVRDPGGALRAFHNTCRHRGSRLCDEARGRLRGAAIVCPYHGWTYGLDGSLRGARHQIRSPAFRPEEHPLHPVALDRWGGFLFVNLLGAAAPPLASELGSAPEALGRWPLPSLRVGHREVVPLACNWKVFWENFSECFHCPGVHPELSRLVPIYGRGLLDPADEGRPAASGGAEATGPLAPGARTWTLDGQSGLPPLPGLGEAERRRGHVFGVFWPSAFVVAHVDYARNVRLRPLGPERTELVVEWLFDPAVLARRDLDLERVVALGRLVVEQDGRACERNQRGLHCLAHEQGVLVPQEYGVFAFQQWVRERVAEAGPGDPPATPPGSMRER
jgi:Rieske 2Fe-2S family protein